MKQVGFRQEAARLGGIGSCGRVVFPTWLTDFRSKFSSSLPTIVIEPTKLAGQCGKLKCC
jgi:cell fate regulator YaaT (PSP1 superfamily)